MRPQFCVTGTHKPASRRRLVEGRIVPTIPSDAQVIHCSKKKQVNMRG